jgi:flagellar hook protein FlgE
MTFTKVVADRAWTWAASGAGVGGGTVSFKVDGSWDQEDDETIAVTCAGAGNLTIDPNFTEMTQSASSTGTSSAALIETDGYGPGELKAFTIDAGGTVVGSYSNGVSQSIGQVALSYCANPSGLQKIGESLYRESSNSGMAQIGEAGSGGRGSISPASLEMSNVELSSEFTSMIITQRGFQANSRVITTSDEMLQELANLKR